MLYVNGKQLNIRLSEQELEELRKKAEERGLTIKDLVMGSLKASNSTPEVELSPQEEQLAEGKPKLAKEKPQLAKTKVLSERTYTWEEVSDSIKGAIKEGDNWLGFELEPVAEALQRLHLEWNTLPEAGKLAILGKYKLQAQLEEYSTERVAKDLSMLTKHITDNCANCEHQVMHFYHRIKLEKKQKKVVEDGEEKEKTVWDASITDSDED